MNTALVLALALVLDAVAGEPKWLWSRLPHPAVLMGRLVQALDDHLNDGEGRRGKGIAAVLALVLTGLILGWILSWFGGVVSVLIAAVLIAQRSLIDHVRAVAFGLRDTLTSGRAAVAQIVSRDTAQMTGPQVARSAIESGAENFSDGVIAPAFWFLVAGLPGVLIYKLINTADSMIGYRTEAYEEFGWAAARLDDLLNLVPARLSALLIALVSGRLSDWGDIAADAQKHRSPNAGWPEAAMARALNVALAGPRSYDGEMRDFAWIHATGSKSADAHSIQRCIGFLWRSWGLALAVTVALSLLF
ncbi:adenosylcobinamide-phosphate synthase CbiB [Tritonibacter horizontis]|uniref:Cobalamin biosynthesis protein CobD n=1 Tax=Tritonibacter horizontis TaxID=1768241 RepID=A0A132BU34_9RHOB|nr:adenosylcobinamide-phosphate synthase CbiB [Tritonibacter horizontis]KUP91881.1 cobalamin biosynthesis protein CbiB [Tritonibacter horizontis]